MTWAGFVTSPRRWQKSLACTASVADVVCLAAVACRRSSARRAARLLFLAAFLHGGLGPRARWREGARGAVLEHPSEARSAEVRAPVFAPVVPALQRRVGGADASDARWPGAALARADAGPRSAAREHRRRVRRRARERRDRPFSDRAQRAPLAPGGVGLTLLGRRASPQRASAKRRRCPGGARGPRSGRPGRSPSPAPHRSGRAGLPHPALQGTASLHVRWWTSRAAGSG